MLQHRRAAKAKLISWPLTNNPNIVVLSLDVDAVVWCRYSAQCSQPQLSVDGASMICPSFIDRCQRNKSSLVKNQSLQGPGPYRWCCFCTIAIRTDSILPREPIQASSCLSVILTRAMYRKYSWFFFSSSYCLLHFYSCKCNFHQTNSRTLFKFMRNMTETYMQTHKNLNI